MSIQVEYSTQGNVLVARAHGVINAVSDEQLDRDVAAQSKQQGLRRVLIDIRQVAGTPPTLNLYHSGTSLEERGFSRTMKIAFLDREVFREQNAFYGTVARNRGFRLQHFYTEAEALSWLQEEP